MEEAYQFDLAIAAALNMTSTADTLIIVTADHSHTMTINGYPERGNNLFGKHKLHHTDILAVNLCTKRRRNQRTLYVCLIDGFQMLSSVNSKVCLAIWDSTTSRTSLYHMPTGPAMTRRSLMESVSI